MSKRLIFAMTMLASSIAAYAEPVFEPGSCQQDRSDVCLDSTPCKRIGDVTVCLAGATNKPDNAVSMTESCWQYEGAYTCRDHTSVDTCTPLRERSCGQVNTECLTTDAQGKCISATQTYQCPDQAPTIVERTVCETALCQQDGTGCFDTSRPTDRDFGQAAAMMEAAREAGIYGLEGENVEVFKGYMEECSVKTFGGSNVKSCCAEAGGGEGFNNYTVLGKTAAEAAYAVGSEEFKAGSKFVYDALFQTQNASLMQEGASAAAGGLSDTAAEAAAGTAGTNFGAYGFTFSYSAEAGFSFVGFDPWSFALAVVIAVVTEWLSCEPEEKTMQLKLGQKLCSYVESYCSSQALGGCTVKQEKHCCFNSVLAKLINRQGRAQLALPLNICDGFSKDQLLALDFSKIDLTEFIETIRPRDVPASQVQVRVTDTVTQKIENYYGTPAP